MSRTLRKRAVTLLLIAVLAYLGYLSLLFLLQRPMMYPGTRMSPPRSAGDPVPEGVEQVWFTIVGERVEGWWGPASVPVDPAGPSAGDPVTDSAATGRPALIVAHGNAELIDDWTREMRAFRELGVGVLLVEYPGYGLSGGTPTRASIMGTFTAAYDWLAGRPEVDPDRLVGYGRSLGGGPITELATIRELRAIVLQSTYTSVSNLASWSYWAPGALVRDDFDNASNLTDYGGSVLILHGIRDRVVPIRHGRRLAGVGDHVRLVELECGHNDCPPNWSAFVEEVDDFLEASLENRPDA